ncbi:MAG TPA: metalloregulator ArsR/SmtB family transcription factor [Thermoanaerobaculia bacterium]|nr:metalloregulator ArsR/SmtB family transcription factor [Thermoanaerobaculia bacterium]
MPAKRTRHNPLSSDAIELVAARFRTLGEPIRIQLLQALQRGERNVTDLVAAVGSTQSNVSKHLRILQDAGLVGRRQDGNSVYYSIADPTVFALCDAVCSSIGTRLTQHATLADELRRRIRRR